MGLLFLKYKLDTPNNGEKAIMDENSVEFNIGFKYSNDEKNTLNGVEGNIKKADAHASAAKSVWATLVIPTGDSVKRAAVAQMSIHFSILFFCLKAIYVIIIVVFILYKK